jgi:hypothetical protein
MQTRRRTQLLKLILIAALLGLGALLSGCHIVEINQPRFAPSLEPIPVKLHIQTDPNSSPLEARPILGVQLPTLAWSVQGEPVYWASGGNSGTLAGLSPVPAAAMRAADDPGNPVQASPSTIARPLAELLNPDGTLDLASGWRGSLDARSWRLASGPGEAPRFASLAAPGDENWADNFVSPGISGPVYALALDGEGKLYAGGEFITAGGVSTNYIAMWNGSSWSPLGSGMNRGVFALALDGSGNHLYAGGYFTTAGGVSANYIAMWDGNSWSALGSGMNSSVHALALDGSGKLYAGGYFTTAGGMSANHIAMWDGSQWSPLGSGMDDGVSALALDGSGKLYASGYFSTAGGVSANCIAMWDGSSWSALGTGMNSSVHALALDGSGKLYAGGWFTTAGRVSANGIARWDGSSWSALGGGMDGGVFALALDGSGNHLYAGGYFTTAGGVIANGIAVWDGSRWSPLGSGMGGTNYPYVSALALDGSGNLYAGGWFTTAGGVIANYIVMWDGSSWSALADGDGMSSLVSALVLDRGGNLYAGGNFTTAGGVSAKRIAMWDGSSWSPLGSGMDDPVWPLVSALALDGSGNLYAGGYFTTAGGVSANCIARWDGSSWSPLGGGMDGGVDTLALDGSGNLYAGGWFTTAGGVSANGIAMWDGSSWSPLGSGMGGMGSPSVRALALDGSGKLYAGGYFTTAGGVSANHIAVWDGSSWSPLGSGMGGTDYPDVYALALDGSENLYAGGWFTTAGGVSANYIAMWDGSSWSALGSGMVGTDYPGVYALALDGSGKLYAGGYFFTAGGVIANGIAVWDGSSWSALGSGMGGTDYPDVYALALDGSGNLYAGGLFTTAGGKPSSYIARWSPRRHTYLPSILRNH